MTNTKLRTIRSGTIMHRRLGEMLTGVDPDVRRREFPTTLHVFDRALLRVGDLK